MGTQEVIRIDGSYGEGGGQILRTALSLSAMTQRPLELFNIRKQRPHPGLGNQHLAAVRAVARLTHAELEGDRLGSSALRFTPHTIGSGEFLFDVAEERGSAGSVTLLLQAILPLLCAAPGPSSVILRGGTHVPWSPPVDYLEAVLLPMLTRAGVSASIELAKAGWYPKGGGEIRLGVTPTSGFCAQQWHERGALKQIVGRSIVSNLPRSIAERQRASLLRVLRNRGLEAEVACVELPSVGRGTCVTLAAVCECRSNYSRRMEPYGQATTGQSQLNRFLSCNKLERHEQTLAGCSSLGRIGTPAEAVGAETAEALLAYLDSGAALDAHLADQAVVFLALAPGPSRFTTSRITQHLLTNLWTVQRCLPLRITVDGEEGQPGCVTLQPI
jgi:RNA 3'-terminal phosphate cyclase (ATP)